MRNAGAATAMRKLPASTYTDNRCQRRDLTLLDVLIHYESLVQTWGTE